MGASACVLVCSLMRGSSERVAPSLIWGTVRFLSFRTREDLVDHPSPSRVALCKQSADLWTQRNVESIARRLAKVRTRLGQSEHPTANWVGNLARTLGGVANMAPGAPHHDPEAWADYVDFWVSAKQGAKILGPSWQKPGADIALAEIGEVDSRLVRDVTALLKTNPRSRVAKKWKKLPPGWTDKSVKKFWGTLTGTTPEHKVWDCIEKMTKPFGDGAGGFCGGLADWQMPGWRQKNKKESPDARSDAKSYWKKKIKNKKADMTPDPTRVAMRFAGPKVASAGSEIVWRILDQRAFMKVWRDLGKEDEQAAELLYEVLTTLQDKLDIADREYNALNRITQLIKAGSSWKPALQRNNIFKAADLLGLKLPSGSF